jgi:T5SS/PEP-CTERM-associated repeat protein
MQAGWTTRADQIGAWREARDLTDKQVVFTEVGLSSYNGSNITPYDSVSEHPGAAADEQEQADGYEALLSVMTQREWWDGAFWWNWETNPNTSSTTSFTPQHKLAIDVLANYYGGVIPPFPTSSWNTNNDGSFGTAGNWNNGVPNSVFVANFERGDAVSYSVTLSTTTRTIGQLRVGSNSVAFTSNNTNIRNITADEWHQDNVNRGVIIGVEAGDVAVVNTSSTFGTLSTRAATIGDAAGSSGTLNLTSSNNLLNVTGAHPSFWEFLVGRAGTGTLNVTGGARVTVSGSGASSVMGLEAGSSGTANVSGSGSLWSTFIALRVGIEGQASLTVANGGTVSAPAIITGLLGQIHGNGTLTGSVTNNGLVSPGTSPGTLTVNGNFSQTADGELLVELASLASFDRLQVSGSATLAGLVTVELLDNYMPQEGDSFDVLNWGTTFTDTGYTFALPELDGPLTWDTSQFGVNGTLAVIASMPNPPGDYNGDGQVDAGDYTVWRDALGDSGAGLAADGSGPTPGVPDGVVDHLDYDFWKSRFGESSGAGTGAGSAAVPEPTALLLAALGCVAVRLRRW